MLLGLDIADEADQGVAVGAPVGAENRVTSCDMQVLVDEAAEPVSSEHADGRPRTRRGAACGRALIEGSVRSVRVEVPDVLPHNDVDLPRIFRTV